MSKSQRTRAANAEKKIQTLTDKFCKEADELTEAKEKEILSI